MSVIAHDGKVVVAGRKALSFDNLISMANQTTGLSDTTLTDAVQSLIDGFGGGGGGAEVLSGVATIVDAYSSINIGKPYTRVFFHSYIKNLPISGSSNYAVEYIGIYFSKNYTGDANNRSLTAALRYNPATGSYTYSSTVSLAAAIFDPLNGIVPLGAGSGYSPHTTDEWEWEAVIME